MQKQIIVGIAGGSGVGKGYLCKHLQDALLPRKSFVVPIDNYYKDLGHITISRRNLKNFDHPDSIDKDLLADHIYALSEGETIDMPKYDFVTHTRDKTAQHIDPKGKIIFVEGIFALFWEKVRENFDIRVFMSLNWETCLERRKIRDVEERGRTPIAVERRFHQTVLPMYKRYIEPTLEYADIILVADSPVECLVREVLEKINNVQGGE